MPLHFVGALIFLFAPFGREAKNKGEGHFDSARGVFWLSQKRGIFWKGAFWLAIIFTPRGTLRGTLISVELFILGKEIWLKLFYVSGHFLTLWNTKGHPIWAKPFRTQSSSQIRIPIKWLCGKTLARGTDCTTVYSVSLDIKNFDLL